jgi:hypothetical protein
LTKTGVGCKITIAPKTTQKARMANINENAVARAKADLAARLKIAANEIKEHSIESADFPDMSLGAPVSDEMSAQMITSGRRIRLNAQGQNYEYRADDAGETLRLFNFNGANFIVQ